jgi:predicted metal-dependent phosphoesterase TrpH
MFVDLHLHTHFSDGTFSPEELAAHAARLQLKAVALTDHDTLEGCPRMAAACEKEGVEFIPACELTAEVEGNELHLLGYFLDIENQNLLAELAKFQAVRQNRIREMAARLNELDIPLEAETVFRLANCKAPGRPHVARALVQEGFCGSLDEAFERFLKVGRPAWVPKFKISAPDAIALAHASGGVVVMAHPGLNRTDDVIPPLVEAGLDGLECFHTKHSTSMTERYMQLADQYNLVITGGSDCHGRSKGNPLIGTIKVPYTHLESLKQRLAERKAGTVPESAAKINSCEAEP